MEDQQAQIHRDTEAEKRAKARTAKMKAARKSRAAPANTASSNQKPILNRELAHFKAIVRYIVSSDASTETQKLFKQNSEHTSWRLRAFGIMGQQPAIDVLRVCTQEQLEAVETAIIIQRTSSTAKKVHDIRTQMKHSAEHGVVFTTKLNWAKLDLNAVVRWKRVTSGSLLAQSHTPPPAPAYRSRMIRCTTCDATRETAHMQLRTLRGYRSITCLNCKAHTHVGRSHCTCGLLWHQCTTHRIDPALHRSTKPKRKMRGEHLREELALSSERPAPDIRDNACAWKRRRVQRDGKLLHQYGGIERGVQVVRLSAQLNPILAARCPHLVG